VSLLPEFVLPYLRSSLTVIALFLITRLLRGTPPQARGRGGVWTQSCLKLFPDLERSFACGVLGRLDRFPPLMPKMLIKAPHVCG
jgi:hypothetical protein